MMQGRSGSTDFYAIRLRAEALQRIDLLAGFLAARYPDDPDTRREVAECAERGRALAAEGRVGEAWDRVLDLRDHAYAWTGHPHHPGDPGADATARVDAHHIAGRGSMAVELGHLAAARAELERLREPRRGLVDAEDDKGGA
ncbi:hypothetical protein ACU4GG_27805 [Streptomyces nojiriensis]